MSATAGTSGRAGKTGALGTSGTPASGIDGACGTCLDGGAGRESGEGASEVAPGAAGAEVSPGSAGPACGAADPSSLEAPALPSLTPGVGENFPDPAVIPVAPVPVSAPARSGRTAETGSCPRILLTRAGASRSADVTAARGSACWLEPTTATGSAP